MLLCCPVNSRGSRSALKLDTAAGLNLASLSGLRSRRPQQRAENDPASLRILGGVVRNDGPRSGSVKRAISRLGAARRVEQAGRRPPGGSTRWQTDRCAWVISVARLMRIPGLTHVHRGVVRRSRGQARDLPQVGRRARRSRTGRAGAAAGRKKSETSRQPWQRCQRPELDPPPPCRRTSAHWICTSGLVGDPRIGCSAPRRP